MVSVWDTIKTRETAPLDVANPDAQVVMDPARGAPVRVRKDESLKFRPVAEDISRGTYTSRDEPAATPVHQRTEYPPADQFKEAYGVTFEEAIAQSNQRIAEASAITKEPTAAIDLEDPNIDLVSEDVEYYGVVHVAPPTPEQPKHCNDGRSAYARALKQLTKAREAAEASKAGRPRKHETNAERQKAYRLRRDAKKKAKT